MGKVKVVHGARQSLVQGGRELSKAVGVTYGPRGGTVMLDRAAGLLSTKDGAAVSWELNPEHPLHRLGTQVVQQALHKVSQEVGDGTSTTAILIGALLEEGNKLITGGHDPASLQREMSSFCEFGLVPVLEALVKEATRNDVRRVALSSSNGDSEMADAILSAFDKVGSNGMVVVEDGHSRGIEVTQKQGLEIDRGWESSDFCPSGETHATQEIALVAIVDSTLTKAEDVVSILETASQFPHPLLVVSKGLYAEALTTVLMNRDKVPAVAVRCPGHVEHMRDHLEDIAALSGAMIYSPSLESFGEDHLGSFQKVTVGKEFARFVAFPDKLEEVIGHVSKLQRRAETTPSTFDRDRLLERSAMLTDGLCTLKVGASTGTEIKERKGRLEDALRASKLAVDAGVVPGASMSYLKISQILEHADTPGEKMLSRALRAPTCQLLRNAGKEPGVVFRTLSGIPFEDWVGWDLESESLRGLEEFAVDSFQVVREVIETAVSAAGTLLTAEIALVQACKEKN